MENKMETATMWGLGFEAAIWGLGFRVEGAGSGTCDITFHTTQLHSQTRDGQQELDIITHIGTPEVNRIWGIWGSF